MEASFHVGDLTLSARERRPAGVPKGIVLALHGGGYGAGYWDYPPTSLLGVAAERGHLGVAIDRPGYGAAFDRPMPLAAQAKVVLDLAAQLRANEGGVPLLLAGHSMGGILALIAAALPQAADSVAAVDACGVPLRYAEPMQRALDARRLAAGETHSPGLDDDHVNMAFFGAEEDFTAEALAHDAALRVPVPAAELPDAANAPRDLPAVMRRIALPVRLSFAAQEASSIASEAIAAEARAHLAGSVRSMVRFEPHAGHNISLHRGGRDFHHAMIDWLEAA
ncbi:MAG TPA: alpha/beta hydrolase [Sphingopyxis sp.]|nr:alpha/beta hydrolase [Sphingopyxis sp.]